LLHAAIDRRADQREMLVLHGFPYVFLHNGVVYG